MFLYKILASQTGGATGIFYVKERVEKRSGIRLLQSVRKS